MLVMMMTLSTTLPSLQTGHADLRTEALCAVIGKMADAVAPRVSVAADLDIVAMDASLGHVSLVPRLQTGLVVLHTATKYVAHGLGALAAPRVVTVVEVRTTAVSLSPNGAIVLGSRL